MNEGIREIVFDTSERIETNLNSENNFKMYFLLYRFEKLGNKAIKLIFGRIIFSI